MSVLVARRAALALALATLALLCEAPLLRCARGPRGAAALRHHQGRCDELGEQFYALTAPGVGVKAGWHKGGRPTDPDDDDLEPDDRIVEAVSNWVRRRLPRVDPEPLRAETCVYTNVAGERFVCERQGRHVIGSACSGHGFKFAPAVGELLADLAAT